MPVDNELHKAAHKGELEMCKMLIEGSVSEEIPLTVNDLGASDRRPLHRAAGAGHLALCTYFLEIGAEIDAVRFMEFCSKKLFKFISFFFSGRQKWKNFIALGINQRSHRSCKITSRKRGKHPG
jgi:ankyrin repeat protein